MFSSFKFYQLQIKLLYISEMSEVNEGSEARFFLMLKAGGGSPGKPNGVSCWIW